jgi:hypothetical protein
MKKYISIGLLITSLSFSQTNEEATIKYEYERLSFEVGAVVPLGYLSQQFKPSANLGFWYRSRVANNNFMDCGVSFYIPQNPSKIILKMNNYFQETRSRNFAGSINIRGVRTYPINMNYSLETNASAGFGFYSYDISFGENPRNCGENKDQACSDFRTFNTIHLAIGTTLRYKNLGIYSQYNFAPYHLFSNKIDKNFGQSYLSLGVVYFQ